MTRDLEFIRKQDWYTPGSDNTIIVDFDGTICEFAYPKEGKLIADTIKALEMLKKAGFTILIHSSRTSRKFSQEVRNENFYRMVDYLLSHGVPFDEVLKHDKPPVLAYIDDSAHRLEGDSKSSNWMKIANHCIFEQEHGR